jgi:hypothetical protein
LGVVKFVSVNTSQESLNSGVAMTQTLEPSDGVITTRVLQTFLLVLSQARRTR